MFRKTLALMLVALIVTASALTAGMCENEPCFVPYLIADAFNRGLAFSVTKFYDSDEEAQNQALNYFAVHYTETMNGFVYFNNNDWSVEISGYFEGTEPDTDTPATSITFSIADSFDEQTKALMQLSLGVMLIMLDENSKMEDLQAVVDFLYEGWTNDVNTLDRDGYRLSAFSYEGRDYFAISQ